jgi:Zn-dependent M16 (insulinase) family peptidase
VRILACVRDLRFDWALMVRIAIAKAPPAALFVLAVALSAPGCGSAPAPRAVAPPPPAPEAPPELASLQENQHAAGFVAQASYVDDDGRPRGARFRHEATGFVFDYLVIESAPQAMIYAWTYPSTDGGEPHTQEHLLLGKGNAGRWLGNVEHSNFGESSAFTADRRTAYHFNTSAGPEAFWRLFQTQLQALLRPDYSDEEIRREVRNFGVAKQPDGTLTLDERGTVYNEMVRATEASDERSWYVMQRLLYGEGHPLSYNQGGTPAGIRELTPEHIRAFHAAHYQLGNMSALGAFPVSIPLGDVLTRAGGILSALATPGARTEPLLTEATLPPAHPAPAGEIRVVEYPLATADNPSEALLGWPADRNLGLDERIALEVFISTLATGRSANLYRALVDRKTRLLDLGATGVEALTRNGAGQPIYVGIENVASAHADEASMKALRDVVRGELERIAALADGSSELASFNERVKAHVVERRRRIDKDLDTPPQFGVRGTSENWVEELDDLARAGGFTRSLVYKEPIAHALALATSKANEWRARIRSWGLLETPYVVVGRPSPELRARLDREREERIAAELARLETHYGTHDPQEALRKRDAESAAASDAIAKAEAEVPFAPLAPDPPMTYDDSLVWKREGERGERVVSTFESMKSATVGLLLRLDDVPDAALPWLGVLPALVSDVGVIRDGKAIPYDEVEDRLRREVLGVEVRYTTDSYSGRAELSIEAGGNDPDETKRALGWTRDLLATPDWRPENLPRLRDVIDAELTRLHDTMAGAEERWVEGTEEAYRRQDRAVLVHASSFLTRAYDAFVVSWRLEGGEEAKGVPPFLRWLADAGKRLDRASLAKLAALLAAEDPSGKIDPKVAAFVSAGRALPKPAQSRVRKAGRDLARFLSDLPDSSLASDWAALCREMAKGVAVSPRVGLGGLAQTLASIRHRDNARVWLVGSTAHQAAIADDVAKTLASLDPTPVPHLTRTVRRPVLERARARGERGGREVAADPAFVALMNPNTANGSLVHSAPSVGFGEEKEEALVAYLAVNVFGGVGTQSFYKRMWGAALAYSDYVYASPREERMELYADRCADLPQLLRFAEGEVRRMPSDRRYVDYALAPAFSSRVANAFELRASAIATDLAEGMTPERIRAFRRRLLALRSKPGLAEAMSADYVSAMSAVVPSLAGSGALPNGAIYFTTGPEPAIAAYEKEIARTRGEGARVLRLWARDFWDVEAGKDGGL